MQQVSSAIERLRRDTFSKPGPPVLYHYTSAAAVEAIAESRTLWATCVADQTDTSELSHASTLVADQVKGISRKSRPSFSLDVLNRLAYFMEERKSWVYIACFCDDHESFLHWRQFGNHRLTFPSPWTGSPSLALNDLQADCWYQCVIYDERQQRVVMGKALCSIALAVAENSYGRNEGPWAQGMLDICARNAAQLLLSVGLGFKRHIFKGEKEWRIICCPRLGGNNSAPTMIDENFRSNVVFLPRRHINLEIKRTFQLGAPLFIAPVPFLDVRRQPR